MSFTDQQRHIATPADCRADWGCAPNGERFRCYLCGHKFKPGDGFRWVYTGGENFEINGKKRGVSNLMTCDACDGPDVIDRWAELHRELFAPKFWAIRC